MTRPNALGEYLRARRELVEPADVGLTVAGVRRTPGLRREELATLAGISADYYLRLEHRARPEPVAAGARGAGARVRARRDGHPVPAESSRWPTPTASSW